MKGSPWGSHDPQAHTCLPKRVNSIPGYTGTLTVDTGDEGKGMMDKGWKDTEVKLTTVAFQKEQ